MTPDLFNITVSVIKSYMETLTVQECRDWALDSGLFSRNTKLKKGENLNIGLELLPSTLSGKNLCLGAGECKYSCLAFAGTGNVLTYKRIYEGGLPTPLQAKCKRTFLFLNDKDFFYKVLDMELESFKRLADLKEMKLAVRMNVTADVDWSEFAKKHSDVQFYDYTKVLTRKELPNYHLTYSASEKTSHNQIIKLLNDGKNVAMVFRKVPNVWNGFPVVDGDVDDNRYENAKGVIIGLKYKISMGKQMESPAILME